MRLTRRALTERAASTERVADLSFNDLLRAAADAGLMRDAMRCDDANGVRCAMPRVTLLSKPSPNPWRSAPPSSVSTRRHCWSRWRPALGADQTLSSGPLQLTPTEIRTVQTILDDVVGHVQVRVFGSRATGRARPFSDLDLLIVEPMRLSWAQRADLPDRFEASSLPFRVDVVEADELPAGMAARVASESVALREP